MIGCASKSKHSSSDSDKKKNEKVPVTVIETVDAKATFTNSKNEPMWTVTSKTGELSVPLKGSGNLKSGTMHGVSGEIFRDSKVVSRFQSKTGQADHDKKSLSLSEDVNIDSFDPAVNLRCDKVTYDGENKIVKAHDHVQIAGTISTVGTIDDLWATPDLKIIASPELFNRPMTNLLPLLLTLHGAPQQTWTDHKGLTMMCRYLKVNQQSKNEADLSLISHVSVNSETQKLKMAADTIRLHATPDPASPKSFLVQHAKANGNVTIVKVTDTKNGKQTSNLSGTSADYTKGTNQSSIKLLGPVRMETLDAKNRSIMFATGDTGTAYLQAASKGSFENALQKALLDGHAHVTLTQFDPSTGRKSTLKTTSDHVSLENIGTDQKLTLKGNVHLLQDENELTGSDTAVYIVHQNGSFDLVSH